MSHSMAPSGARRTHAPRRPTRPCAVSAIALCGLILCGSAGAADVPGVSSPTAPQDPGSGLSGDPAVNLNTMADHLDTDATRVVMLVASLPITQDDLAGVIRSMPANMGNLPGPEIYRRALDVMVRQKAMVLHAKQDHLEQDPALNRQGQIAFERIISDAWLQRRATAAVTEQALHARYERDFAGRPGPALP
jgi:peptidyl-prolyl cis-trans isomerase C